MVLPIIRQYAVKLFIYIMLILTRFFVKKKQTFQILATTQRNHFRMRSRFYLVQTHEERTAERRVFHKVLHHNIVTVNKTYIILENIM